MDRPRVLSVEEAVGGGQARVWAYLALYRSPSEMVYRVCRRFRGQDGTPFKGGG